jgi:hypothetical protein
LKKRIHSGIERIAQAIQAIHYLLSNAKSIPIFGTKKIWEERFQRGLGFRV